MCPEIINRPISRIQKNPDPEVILDATTRGLYVKKPNVQIEFLKVVNEIMQSNFRDIVTVDTMMHGTNVP